MATNVYRWIFFDDVYFTLGSTHMQAIFISYRRDDCPYAAHLVYARLVADFGARRVFMDIDDIPLGEDFRAHISRTVDGCSIALAIIGENWHGARPQGKLPRIHNPKDFVRIEVETALRRQIPVIPVLVANAMLPSEDDLPESLHELVYRNAAEVRAGRDCTAQLATLSRGIEKHLGRLAQLDAGENMRTASISTKILAGAPIAIINPRKIMSTPGVVTPESLSLAGVTDTLAYQSICARSHESKWPPGIRSTSARWANQDKNLLAMRQYKAYKIADIGPKAHALIRVPAAENQHMQADMRPKEDFYILIEAQAVGPVGR